MSPTAHNQTSVDNQTDVFVVDSSGRLLVRWVIGTNPWQGPTDIGNPTFPPGATLAASQQFGIGNQTDVFGIANSGKLAVAYVTGKDPWRGPIELFNANYEPGAPVAASQQFGIPDQTDLFAINRSGELTVAYVLGKSEWNAPKSISGGVFPTRGKLAVSQRFDRDITDVYAVNNSGALTVTSVEGKGKWSGQTNLSGPNTFPPGAGVAAGAQFGLQDQTDVFAVDQSGAITVTWYDGNKWNGPRRISESGLYPPGANVETSRQFGLDQTDVFAVNKSGQVTVNWVTKDSDWDGPYPISDSGFAAPGARVAASEQFGVSGQTDLFVQKPDGSLWVFWVTKDTPWQGPSRI